jgi:hypothetical protein
MEKNSSHKKDNSLTIYMFIVLTLILILVIFVTDDGMNTTQGIGIAGALFFMIVVGIVKITKLQISKKPSRESQPTTPTPISPMVSNNEPGATLQNTGANPTISSGVPHVGKPLPGWIQNLKSWFQKFPKPKQLLILAGSCFVIIIVIIIAFSGVTGEPNTTITGTWEHELVGINDDRDWIVCITMWNVDPVYDSGYIYMNVNENGTFTLFYNTTLVSEGTWEKLDSGYQFLYTDPEEIIAGGYYEYILKGSHLYFSQNIYFTKKIS